MTKCNKVTLKFVSIFLIMLNYLTNLELSVYPGKNLIYKLLYKLQLTSNYRIHDAC